MTMFSVPSR